MPSAPNLTLRLLPGTFAVHQLEPEMAIPESVLDSEPFFVGQTDEELSIVCRSEIEVAAAKTEPDWACFKVEGPLDFTLVGVLARISDTLARERISIFAVSTFDTDYILVKNSDLDRALKVLAAEGYEL